MAANVKVITDDAQFQPELTNAGTRLVVVDFYATWCQPCQRIAPAFQEMAMRYPRAVFLKVDVDQCQETASSQGVTAMPTFVFYRNKVKIDLLQGANAAALEEKVRQWMGPEEEGGDDTPVKGHMDLQTFINKSGCECLNEADAHPLADALTNKGGHLESDCDEQLIIAVAFTQAVKLHSLKIMGPPEKGPKTVKVFINQPRTLDFDSADNQAPVQTLELTPEDLKEGGLVPLRYVKFQNVTNITLFIKDNQGNGEVTEIDYIGFIGSPVASTNMSDFKRVAGKKGESH